MASRTCFFVAHPQVPRDKPASATTTACALKIVINSPSGYLHSNSVASRSKSLISRLSVAYFRKFFCTLRENITQDSLLSYTYNVIDHTGIYLGCPTLTARYLTSWRPTSKRFRLKRRAIAMLSTLLPRFAKRSSRAVSEPALCTYRGSVLP